MKRIILSLAVLTLGSAMAFAGGAKEGTASAGSVVTGVELNGAGATFPVPLYTAMFDKFSKDAGNKVNYNGIGSGGGIKQLIARTVDFAGSDAPLNSKEAEQAGAEVLHIPATVGAIVLTYNLPEVTAQLKLDSGVITDIYMGKITKWNDARLSALNPGVKLPATDIAVIYRSDSSGTSFNFTTYLSKVNADFKAAIGATKTPKFPVGVGGQGNPGVAASVKQIPGAIGYVEIAYARQNKMPVAQVKNASGNFIDPNDLAAVGKAAEGSVPADGKVDVVNSAAPGAYPISATTWILLYKDQTYTGKAQISRAVVQLVWWMIHDGQKLSTSVDYAPLPAAAVEVGEKLLKSVTFDGKPLL